MLVVPGARGLHKILTAAANPATTYDQMLSEHNPASSELAINQLALERLRPFAGKPVSKAAIDACCSALTAEGTLRVPSLIVRCSIRDRKVKTDIVVDKAISRWRLSEGLLPFLSRSLSHFPNRAEFLILLSDNLYPSEVILPRLCEHFENVPFLRCDWNDRNSHSLKSIPIPDFHIQLPSYADAIASIATARGQYPFDKRRRKAFWRGSLSGPQHATHENLQSFPRYKLLEIARTAPAMIDARLTNYDDIATRDHDGMIRDHLTQQFGELAAHVPESGLVAHRYAISIEGAVAAWRRVPIILAAGCVLLLQHEWKQFFYPGLQPWKHYVPIRTDVSDLLDRYSWLEDHPAEAEAIASAGHAFAMRFLTPSALESYFTRTLRGISGEACVG